ncbi:MAG: hypothetical protein ACRBB0_06915 [Pelagimonas sp.]|uniref:hypothetical protein n=1 Tax=Pelagimonas sp. TaxID=2073170 RepID=UPI003D6BD148
MPEYRLGMPEIADLSGITGHDLNFNNMKRLAMSANIEGKESGVIKKIGIFAPDPAIYGMARMFSTLSELEPGNAKGAAFQTQEETLQWLGRRETSFQELPDYNLVHQDE